MTYAVEVLFLRMGTLQHWSGWAKTEWILPVQIPCLPVRDVVESSHPKQKYIYMCIAQVPC